MSQDNILNNPWNIVGICLGIIGVLMATNSYITQIQEEKFAILEEKSELKALSSEMKQLVSEIRLLVATSKQELKSLSTEAYNDFSEEQQTIAYKLSVLEKHVEEHEKVTAYYNDLDPNIVTKLPLEDLIEELQNVDSSEDKLLVIASIWHDNDYVAEIARGRFLALFDARDMYLVVKSASLTEELLYVPEHIMLRSWFKRIALDDVSLIQDALVKVVINNADLNDHNISTIVEYSYESLSESVKAEETIKSLKTLKRLFSERELKYSIKTTDELYLKLAKP
ncbi:TPA: hypothetical protein GRI37_09090 [Vibrio parahaemolyticus]|nr:hypothetical protein [Vibrio parahaemolyticus]HAS6874068.1 hypothetical protein [Vibrio parahaemolyticus]HCE2442195.1 hypothetical protein [Vibrio parahaemolyticus]